MNKYECYENDDLYDDRITTVMEEEEFYETIDSFDDEEYLNRVCGWGK